MAKNTDATFSKAVFWTALFLVFFLVAVAIFRVDALRQSFEVASQDSAKSL